MSVSSVSSGGPGPAARPPGRLPASRATQQPVSDRRQPGGDIDVWRDTTVEQTVTEQTESGRLASPVTQPGQSLQARLMDLIGKVEHAGRVASPDGSGPVAVATATDDAAALERVRNASPVRNGARLDVYA